MDTSHRHIAILGSVGVPACYGGFETLAEQLARFHATNGRTERLSITCSAPAFADHPRRFLETDLDYLPLPANGASSVLYDALSLSRARSSGADVALLLGVSGAVALPVLRRGKMRVVVHVDGQEWTRAKWSPSARRFLRWSEGLAMRHADAIIADSPAIADDLWHRHGRRADVLSYGGDQAVGIPGAPLPAGLPDTYALAICRIEPENNVDMILSACAATETALVCVGNWNKSRYGRALRRRFGAHPKLHLLDPIYDEAPLQSLRRKAALYLHGHSAGGTNPSLVEMMHVGRPILAYDCIFNHQTTRGAAQYFADEAGLSDALRQGQDPAMGANLRMIAGRDYRWQDIGAAYFDLFERVANAPRRAAQVTPRLPFRSAKRSAPTNRR